MLTLLNMRLQRQRNTPPCATTATARPGLAAARSKRADSTRAITEASGSHSLSGGISAIAFQAAHVAG